AISKVKSLVNYQEKMDEKLDTPEGKKLGAKKKEEVQKEIAKRQRTVENAFHDIAMNRKTINALSAKIKGYWERGQEHIVERKKIFDFLVIKEAKQMRDIAREFKKGPE